MLTQMWRFTRVLFYLTKYHDYITIIFSYVFPIENETEHIISQINMIIIIVTITIIFAGYVHFDSKYHYYYFHIKHSK